MFFRRALLSPHFFDIFKDRLALLLRGFYGLRAVNVSRISGPGGEFELGDDFSCNPECKRAHGWLHKSLFVARAYEVRMHYRASCAVVAQAPPPTRDAIAS